MTAIERVSGADALATSDDWTSAPPAPVIEERPYDDETAMRGAVQAAHILGELRDLSEDLDANLGHALDYWRHHQHIAVMAGVVAVLQDVRRELGQREASVARAAGQTVRDEDLPREGVLQDGRRYEVLKGADRKAWDHDGWKAAVRRQVLSGVPPVVVDPETQEVVDVPALLEGVQEAHGSTAPRVGVLRKKLGLDPDDFCESVPGPWTVRVHGDAGDDE